MSVALRDLLDSKADFVAESRWFSVDAERLSRFEAATGATRSAADCPAVPASHDLMLLSLIPAMLAGLIALPQGAAILNYGLDGVRRHGDLGAAPRVRGRFRLRSRLPLQPRQVLLKFLVTFEAEAVEAPVLTVESLMAVAYFEATEDAAAS